MFLSPFASEGLSLAKYRTKAITYLGILILAFLAGAGLVLLRGRRPASSPGTTKRDIHAAETGSFDIYLDRIAAFSATSLSNFFVVAQAVGQPHFLQVSVGGTLSARIYQFDVPVTGWSEVYAKKIEAEALRRGLAPYYVNGGPMSFLDVDFSDAEAHAEFARWVVAEVFGLPDSTKFEVTSGTH